MIVILGDTHDDVLYFETVLVGKDEQLLFNRFRVRSGSIASQQVLVVHNMSSILLFHWYMTVEIIVNHKNTAIISNIHLWVFKLNIIDILCIK